MRARLCLAGLALLALVAARSAPAEPIGSYFTLTPFGGYTVFDGDLFLPDSTHLTDDLYVGGRLGWRYRRGFGIEAAGGFTPSKEDVAGGPDVNFWHVSGNLMLTPFQGRSSSAATAGARSSPRPAPPRSNTARSSWAAACASGSPTRSG